MIAAERHRGKTSSRGASGPVLEGSMACFAREQHCNVDERRQWWVCIHVLVAYIEEAERKT